MKNRAGSGDDGEHAVRLSVVVPVHDSGALVLDTVGSILREKEVVGGALEVIVVDDRSSEPATLQALKSLNKQPHVRVIPSERPPGPAGARNTGIAAAEGEWIAFLDGDDLWLPRGLEARWRIVEKEPEAAFVSADFRYLHEDGSEADQGFYRTREVPREVLAPAFESGQPMRLERPVPHFLRAVLVWTGVVLVRRSLITDVGCFDESLGQAEDDHLWIRLANRSDLFFVPEVVALYRQWGGGITKRKPAPALWNVVAYRKLLRDPEFRRYRRLLRRRLSQFAEQNVYYHRSRRERARAAWEGVTAVAWDPTNPQRWKALAGVLAGRL